MRKGFTLIEVFIGMFVIIMGAIGALGLIVRTVSSTSLVHAQLTASYLAQEGLELVRNMRDANFLKIHKGTAVPWNDGLVDCASGCQADYNDGALASFQDIPLKLDNGFYAYDAGEDTVFIRKIIIDSATVDVLKVSVDVSWQDRGRDYAVHGATELYNWLSPAQP